MLGDHVNSSCTGPAGLQMWTSSQGEGVNAFSDMYAACKAYGSCPDSASYYNDLADELALSTIGDTGPYPHSSQVVPTVDTAANCPSGSCTGGVLSEPCTSSGTPPWPDGCSTSGASFLIFKGNFGRGIYCSNNNLHDSALTNFASVNAAAIANLAHFGLLWDDGSNSQTVNWPTQASVLDGLNADLGTNYAMC
jgi:hypothetical protein